MRLLVMIYKLQDNLTKILIGSRLRGRAVEWFRSRLEYIEMSANDLLLTMRDMFNHPNKLTRKREFETRVWKRGEAFSTYMHDKIILANKVPKKDIINYIIDGYSRSQFTKGQARIQRFTTTASLLEAFEKITLRSKGQQNGIAATRFSGGVRQRIDGRERSRPSRCFNCGMQSHRGADCPTRESVVKSGVKCFRCGDRGHIAARCPKNRAL